MSRLTTAQLDAILALQLSVAWAGESGGDPPRLGWWKSDLVDRKGGGDLFSRLVPKTAAWASLTLLREAARRTDESLRQRSARADGVWTLFHFGFDVDEQLADRLSYHRQHQHVPKEVFGEPLLVEPRFTREAFESALGSFGAPRFEVTPGGRKIHAAGASAPEAARLLTGALLPLADTYPLPYLEVPG